MPTVCIMPQVVFRASARESETQREHSLSRAVSLGRAMAEQAISAHATRLGETLRREPRLCVLSDQRARPGRTDARDLDHGDAAGDDERPLAPIKAARLGLARTCREPVTQPWRFSKAGIVTTDLMRLDASPRALIGQLDRARSGPLMAAIDACNARFGRGSVVPARAGLVEKRTWSAKFEMRTPRYTTQVGELPVAVAD
jgi:DNA polymerase V